MLTEVERTVLTDSAQHLKLRGLPMLDVVTEIQKCQDFVTIDEGTEAEWFWWGEYLKHVESEIKRRRLIPQLAQTHDNEILLAIKQATPIEDVLEWYTEVFYHRQTWTYRCTLHGPDNHPSGHIYRDEKRAWCFTCNQGGDLFDG